VWPMKTLMPLPLPALLRFMKPPEQKLSFRYPDPHNAGEPFCTYFVYTKTQRLVIKGSATKVKDYVDHQFPQSIYYATYWKQGECRGFWGCGKGMAAYWSQRRFGNRNKWVLCIDTAVGFLPQALIVRRIPRKWLTVYDQAVKIPPKENNYSNEFSNRNTVLESGLKEVLSYVWKKFNEGDPEAEAAYWVGVTALDNYSAARKEGVS
jgi:hypothetical protein